MVRRDYDGMNEYPPENQLVKEYAFRGQAHGVPECFPFLSTMVNRPIQFYSCFISYSTVVQSFAERLQEDLQNSGAGPAGLPA
jgi:hypothetical protein